MLNHSLVNFIKNSLHRYLAHLSCSRGVKEQDTMGVTQSWLLFSWNLHFGRNSKNQHIFDKCSKGADREGLPSQHDGVCLYSPSTQEAEYFLSVSPAWVIHSRTDWGTEQTCLRKPSPIIDHQNKNPKNSSLTKQGLLCSFQVNLTHELHLNSLPAILTPWWAWQTNHFSATLSSKTLECCWFLLRWACCFLTGLTDRTLGEALSAHRGSDSRSSLLLTLSYFWTRRQSQIRSAMASWQVRIKGTILNLKQQEPWHPPCLLCQLPVSKNHDTPHHGTQ